VLSRASDYIIDSPRATNPQSSLSDNCRLRSSEPHY